VFFFFTLVALRVLMQSYFANVIAQHTVDDAKFDVFICFDWCLRCLAMITSVDVRCRSDKTTTRTFVDRTLALRCNDLR
jgi:hypothetical protein